MRVLVLLLTFVVLGAAYAFAPPGPGFDGPPLRAAFVEPRSAWLALAGDPNADGPTPRAPVPVTGFGWPLDGTPTVVRRFDPPPEPWLAGHRGVDLAGEPGAPVRAAGAGTVAFAGTVAGRGVVSIDHANGLRTTYEPVAASVTAGAAVAQGTRIGVLAPGHAGCPAAACLHWGLRRGDTYLDPLLLLGFARVRLLPLNQRPLQRLQERREAVGQSVVLVGAVVDVRREPQ